MRAATKAILLLVAGYLGSLIAVVVTVGTIIAVMSPHGCADLSRTLLVLWMAIASILCLSVALVGVAAWRLELGKVGRVALLCTYSAFLLATCLVIGLGLMLAFNC